MIKVSEVIVVEGRYDKAALSSYLDAVILETDGFGVFSDKEKIALLRRLADERGLVILTDSDGGGFVIRNYLKSCLDPNKIKQAYIPEISGKERRKKKPSKEGLLGVEGMTQEVVLEALHKAGATIDGASDKPQGDITKADLYAWGLSGKADSERKRKMLLKSLELPEKLSSNAMLAVLNALYDRNEIFSQISQKIL